MIIGIDLGTTRSAVSYMKGDEPVLIKEVAPRTNGLLPSVVGVNARGERIIGEAALRQGTADPDLVVEEVKRAMGTDRRFRLLEDVYTPQEIAARILSHLKDEAERYLGKTVTDAVITVPAYFNDRQRRTTRDAATIAGLHCRRLVNEPTAAALAYGLQRPQVEEKIVVYDFGGGTFDVTVLELSEGLLDVLASTGDAELGGKDLDERLMELLQRDGLEETGIDLMASTKTHSRLRHAAREAKEELSFNDSAHVMIEWIGMDDDGEAIHFERNVTRHEFEAVVRELIEKTPRHIENALADAELSADQIDTVLLIGGSSRVPLVREIVGDYFPGRTLRTELDPDTAVGLGAAILAGIEDKQIGPETIVMTDKLAHALGVETVDDDFSEIIPKNTTIPCTRTEEYYTVGDNQQFAQIVVYQGDDPKCTNNDFVGKFLHEIRQPGPAGMRIDIEMSYDLSGIVEIVASEVPSGHKTHCRITPDGVVLSGDEVGVARQRLYTEDTGRTPPSGGDTQPRPGVPPVPQMKWSDSPLYPSVAALIEHTERYLEELEGNERVRVNRALNELKSALSANDEAAVKARDDELTDLLFELG